MNISNIGSSTSGNPSDEQRSQRCPPSPTRRTLLSHPAAQSLQGASPASNIVSTGTVFEESGVQHRPGGMEQGEGEHSAELSSPSVSSSQGDIADNEMEAGPSQPSEQPAPAAPPPKKKRTRTLTTPHQSAVLHALLAQSRFPTTAMREEVGRSIGLSARKVQIWFQNQRQKARRPRGQSGAPLTRPPQYGPFPNAPPGSASSEVSTGSSAHGGSTLESHASMSLNVGPSSIAAGPSGLRSPTLDRIGQAEPYVAQGYPRNVSSSQLSGPGIPGPSCALRTSYPLPRELRDMTMIRSEGLAHTVNYPDVQPTSLRPPTAGESLEMYRPTPRPVRPSRAPFSEDVRARHSDIPVTLPPIALDPVDPRAGLPSTTTSNRYPPLAPIHSLVPVPSAPYMTDRHGRQYASQQFESPFRHQPSLNIPPPFTLQPRPQWDDPAFSPFSRPGPSSLSRPSSSYRITTGDVYSLPPVEHASGPSSGLPSPMLSQSRLPEISQPLSGLLPSRTRPHQTPSFHPRSPNGPEIPGYDDEADEQHANR